MKKCPFCSESIQDEAIKCRFCGEWLTNEEKTPKTIEVMRDKIEKALETGSDEDNVDENKVRTFKLGKTKKWGE